MNPDTARMAIELIRVGVTVYEATQAGNEDEARRLLRSVADRVRNADSAWQAARDAAQGRVN